MPTFAPIGGGGTTKPTITGTTGSPTVDTSSRPGKTIYKFTGSGTITLGTAGWAEVLVVGGGGAGYNAIGGAGAGGVVYNTSYYMSAGTWTVTVTGGMPNNTFSYGPEYVSSLKRFGIGETIGALGGTLPNSGSSRSDGASGGGGGGTQTGGTWYIQALGQGFQGGNGSSGWTAGAGGGGAGAAGTNQTLQNNSSNGTGGIGLLCSIDGTARYYGGGGGGGGFQSGAAGGSGGGGAGQNYNGGSGIEAAVSGTANTGGGGGGRYSGTASAGGSGIVIVVI